MKKFIIIIASLLMLTYITSSLFLAVDIIDARNQHLAISPYFRVSANTSALLFLVLTMLTALFLLFVIAIQWPEQKPQSINR